jgi:hypothetical protein
MFDHGITHLIEYPKTDGPMNALALTYDYQLFGIFKIYFEPTGNPYATCRNHPLLFSKHTRCWL